MRLSNWSIIMCVAAALVTAKKIEDTEANRIAEANKVLKASPIEETLENMIKEVSKGHDAQKAQVSNGVIILRLSPLTLSAQRERHIHTHPHPHLTDQVFSTSCL